MSETSQTQNPLTHNLAILGLGATTFSSTWTSIDIKETSIVTKAAYQREPFFIPLTNVLVEK